ncbi:glycosyltransferase [Psychroserpens luteus]|uniref:Glycosyltransferase n=1 Tax=Psychroserpens luteus TaxID=1434066 RepID=A0ABW6A0E2_9FLAO|nr:glycosyltransferase [Psychroserpens luteus]
MSKRKTVLAFIDWYRPGYKAGGTITAFGNFVDYLEDDIDFKIVTRNIDYADHQPYASIPPGKWVKSSNSSCYYMSQSEVSIKNIKNIIANTDYDFLYVNGMFSPFFSILPVLFSKGKNTIVNPHGMLSTQAFSVKPLKKKMFLSVFNALKIYKNTTFHAANEEEAVMISDRVKRSKAVKIANQFPRKLKNISIKNSSKNNPIRLINVARISIEKGTLIMIEALSVFKTEVVLDIFGPVYDHEYWEKCQIAIQHLPNHITVNYKGVVESELVLDTLKAYDFFILLSEGENFGHSILEALSVGCPVIISDKTPWTNLKSKGIGWDLNVKDINRISDVFSEISNMSQEDYNHMVNQSFSFAQRFSEDQELLNQNKNLFLITH